MYTYKNNTQQFIQKYNVLTESIKAQRIKRNIVLPTAIKCVHILKNPNKYYNSSVLLQYNGVKYKLKCCNYDNYGSEVVAFVYVFVGTYVQF